MHQLLWASHQKRRKRMKKMEQKLKVVDFEKENIKGILEDENPQNDQQALGHLNSLQGLVRDIITQDNEEGQEKKEEETQAENPEKKNEAIIEPQHQAADNQIKKEENAQEANQEETNNNEPSQNNKESNEEAVQNETAKQEEKREIKPDENNEAKQAENNEIKQEEDKEQKSEEKNDDAGEKIEPISEKAEIEEEEDYKGDFTAV